MGNPEQIAAIFQTGVEREEDGYTRVLHKRIQKRDKRKQNLNFLKKNRLDSLSIIQ